MRVLTLCAVVALGAASPLAAQQPAPARPDSAPKPAASTASLLPAVTPVADQARGVDAELRAALFDLVADRPLTALSRLEWLASSKNAMSVSPATGQRTREDLLFLLAESYYRLGLSASFRNTSGQLLKLAPAGHYVPLIQLQLTLDAYRRGDYAGARAEAAKSAGAPDASLTDFVGGLAAYQGGDITAARASFAKVIAAADPAYAPYAKYMDAIAAMQGDTARAAAALETLRPLAAGATGPFGDQLRLAAARLAFQTGRFDVAAQLAGQVPPTSGLAPDASLARAWSLYRAGQYDSAAAIFGDFATKWPQLPGRDEARLMHGQILLEQHHPADADAYFTLVGDSLGAEITALQSKLNAAMASAAHGLVAARASGALFVREAATGKSMALAPNAGAEGGVLVAAFAGVPSPARADSTPPSLVTVGDLQARFASVTPALPADITMRPLYANASGPAAYGDYLQRDQNLLAADLKAAIARYRLQAATGDYAMRIAALKNLQVLITEGTANLTEMNKQIAFTQDSLTKMTGSLATAREQMRRALLIQAAATAKVATVNMARLDSVKASLDGSVNPIDADILATEAQTAAIYRRLADLVTRSADSAIGRHPAFSLKDSLGVRLVRARALSAEGQQLLAANAVLVTAELARLNASEGDRTRGARQELAAAEQSRAIAELQMFSMLDGELRARASQMLTALKASREAADYGSASAAFFQVIDTKASGSAGGSASPAPEKK
jgi:hypothetical protein